MRFHWFSWTVSASLLLTGTPALAGDLHIRYAEPIALQAAPNATAVTRSLRSQIASGRLSFQAYGRQFDLDLESNARLLAARQLQRSASAAGSAAAPDYQLLRGRVAGLAGSWVRITRIGEELHGAIWDGSELYTIEPARIVNRFATDRLAVSGSTPVVYRLSDSDAGSRPMSCGAEVPDQRRTALAAYDSLVGELAADSSLASVTGSEIEVAVIGDYEFYTTHPDNTEAELLARMNIVDGIFGGQLGVDIVVSQVKVFTTPSEPFSTNKGSDLLEQVGRYRSSSAELRSAGIAHLITGRDIADNMAGIAYVGTVCDDTHGVAISEGQFDLTTTALISAHEIGHNFGASHDAVSGSPCEGTAPTYLMAAQINGSNTFSQCSLEHMRPIAAHASCVTRMRLIDASIEATPETLEATAGKEVMLPVEVSAVGKAQLNDVQVSISLQAPVAVEFASVPGGSCAAGAGGVTCQLGAIEARGTRRINVTLLSQAAGTFEGTVKVSTPDDTNSANDTRVISLLVSPTAQSPGSPVNNGGGSADTGDGGSGGGGATGFGLLLALYAVLRRRFRRTSAPVQPVAVSGTN
ncbi:MAG TPA: M12 family metallo-peptidase [Steroidobacteraceae bacterium]|jgi:hypothetical protein